MLSPHFEPATCSRRPQTAPEAPAPAKAPKRASPAKPQLAADALEALRLTREAAEALPPVDEGAIEWYVEGMPFDDNPEPPLAGQKVGGWAVDGRLWVRGPL